MVQESQGLVTGNASRVCKETLELKQDSCCDISLSRTEYICDSLRFDWDHTVNDPSARHLHAEARFSPMIYLELALGLT